MSLQQLKVNCPMLSRAYDNGSQNLLPQMLGGTKTAISFCMTELLAEGKVAGVGPGGRGEAMGGE